MHKKDENQSNKYDNTPEKTPRLLYINRDPPGVGGAEHRLLEITKRLQARGYCVYVFSAKTFPNMDDAYNHEGVKFFFFPIVPEWVFRFQRLSFYLVRYLFYPRTFFWKKHIQCIQPDIIIDYITPAPSLISLLAKQMGIPCLAEIMEYRRLKEWIEATTISMSVFGFIAQIFIYRKLPYKATITVSNFTQKQLQREPHSIHHDVAVIPNAIDVTTYQLPIHKPLKKKNSLIVVGRLMKQKGHHYLIQALSIVKQSIPDVHLVIVGEGPLQNKLENQAEKLALSDNITFTGWVTEEEKVSYYHQASIFVMPSVQEGFGIVLLEAMACSLPIIAFDLSVYHEILTEQCGFLVPKGDVDALAIQIIDLLNDEERQGKIGEHNYQYVKQFNWDDVTDKMEELLQRYL